MDIRHIIWFVFSFISGLIEGSQSLKLTYKVPTAEKTYLQFLCTATVSVDLIGVSKNGAIIANYDVKNKKKTKTEDFATINYYTGNKMLELKYDKPDCNQYGNYHCVADGKNSSDFFYGSKTFPVDLEMVVDPEKSAYEVKDTITFICSAKLGNPPKEWSWNTRVNSDNATVDWNSYTTDITTQERQNSGCQFTQETSLSYTVKNDDDGRQFQCTLGESFSKSFEIKTSSGSMKLENLIPVCFCIIAFLNLL